MFINEDYSNYKYLVDYSDNYIVLSRSSSIYGSSGDQDTIPVLVQYFQPSEYFFTTTYSSFDTRSFTDVSSSFSSNFVDRPDLLHILGISFIFIFIITWTFNQLTKIFKKGGILGFS